MLVHNNEESDCPAGGLIYLAGAHHPAALHGTDYFEGYQAADTANANMAVAQAPISAGMIGLAKIDGITIIKSSITTFVAGDYCGPQAGSFEATAGCLYRVLFTESSGTIIYACRDGFSVVRAKAQESSGPGYTLAVKLLAGGNPVGDPINVQTPNTIRWDFCRPLVTTDDYLLVTVYHGVWWGVGFGETPP